MMKKQIQLLIAFAAIINFSGCAIHADLGVNHDLHKKSPKSNPSYAKNTTVRVTASRLNLRSCPGTKCRIITVLSRGTRVSVREFSGAWIKVTQEDDQISGWLYGEYVELASRASQNNMKKKQVDSAPEKPHDVSEVDKTRREGPVDQTEKVVLDLETEGESAIEHTDNEPALLLEDNVVLAGEEDRSTTKHSESASEKNEVVEEFVIIDDAQPLPKVEKTEVAEEFVTVDDVQPPPREEKTEFVDEDDNDLNKPQLESSDANDGVVEEFM